MPALSAVISTRNRGTAVIGTLRSLLAEPDQEVEVVVVDQSDDETTERAVREAFVDARLRYERSPRRGLSAGRNDGTAMSRAPIVAMTDDDCEVEPGWFGNILRTFEDPRISLAFGEVRPAPYDPSLGFIPAYHVAEAFVGTRVWDQVRLDGMGACMAYRRNLWERLGGFDESFGAGTAFPSAEETDFCLRALVARRAVRVTPTFGVVHYGFRPLREGGDLVRAYWYGTGGVFGKLCRHCHIGVAVLLARLAWRFLSGVSPVATTFAGTASRQARLRAFGHGVRDGAGLGRRTRRLAPAGTEPPSAHR